VRDVAGAREVRIHDKLSSQQGRGEKAGDVTVVTSDQCTAWETLPATVDLTEPAITGWLGGSAPASQVSPAGIPNCSFGCPVTTCS
jgi:hypothetical protein